MQKKSCIKLFRIISAARLLMQYKFRRLWEYRENELDILSEER